MIQSPTDSLPDVAPAENEARASERLRREMAAVRLSFTWFGARKSLTREQKEEAADAFGAEGAFLSAGKKLLDTRHAAFKAVTALRGQMITTWRGMTLPYPEPGLRLLPRARIEEFNAQLQRQQLDLGRAVENLDLYFHELKRAAQERLGRLYNSADYPSTLDGLFEVSWDFPSIEPPDYLRQLSPHLYEEECRRVSAKFEEAVELAETAFIEELSKMIAHLGERLAGAEDGKPKIFRDSAIENLQEFFERFRRLNVRSNEQLDGLVQQCQQVVRGALPTTLRNDPSARSRIAGQLSVVGASLEGLMVDRPRRNLLRRPREAT